MRKAIITAVFGALFPIAAQAATYTYDFDFTFAMSGDVVDGFRNEGPGGPLTGFVTLDENKNIVDFDFDFTIIQRANRFQGNQTDIVDLDIDDGDYSSTSVTMQGFTERTSLFFGEINGATHCPYRNQSGYPFSLSFAASNFTAGDASVDFEARSNRATWTCNQFGALTGSIPQSTKQTQISMSVMGTLRVDAPQPETPAVPLPAAGFALVGGLAGLFGLRRRAKS